MKQPTFDDALDAYQALIRQITAYPEAPVKLMRAYLAPMAIVTSASHRVLVMTYELLRTRAKPFSPEAAILEEIAKLMPYVKPEQAPATDQGDAAAKGEPQKGA